MTRVSQRLWIGLLALVAVWIITYWLTPSPAGPMVSTPDELRQAAGRAEQAEHDTTLARTDSRNDPFVTVIDTRPGSSENPETSPPSPRDQDQRTEPAPPPQPQPQRDPESPAIIPPTFQIYTVATGDTMSSVAEQFYGTPLYAGQIARANPTVDPIRLRPGTELKVPTDPRNIQGIPADPALQPDDPEPAFIEYTVTRGDTLSEIARSFYGRSALWTHIRDANPSINRDATNIRPGMTIRIPPPPR